MEELIISIMKMKNNIKNNSKIIKQSNELSMIQNNKYDDLFEQLIKHINTEKEYSNIRLNKYVKEYKYTIRGRIRKIKNKNNKSKNKDKINDYYIDYLND